MRAFLLRWLNHFYAAIVVCPLFAEQVILRIESALMSSKRFGGKPWLWPFLHRQNWQFDVERILHRRGRGRVQDPLFDASLRIFRGERTDATKAKSGRYRISIKYDGLHINGVVTDPQCDRVEIFLNGTLVRKSAVLSNREIKIKIIRPTLLRFPREANLVVRTTSGAYLSYRGAIGVSVGIPTGDGSIIEKARAGVLINKKGFIAPAAEEVRAHQDGYLRLYAEVRDFFEQELGRSLFLMYGTLLGVHRGGDFIPNDDDFDGGYITDETEPKRIKEETIGIAERLIHAGYTIIFNRRGRMFRIQKERGGTDGLHLDLRPVWFDGGNMIAHKQACLPASRSDFLPVKRTTLRGVPVDLPANPEALLEGYYGPGWRVPDPGYVNDASKVPDRVMEILGKAYITPIEYLRLEERVAREAAAKPGCGRLVSIPRQNLYPIEDFIE